MTIKELMFNPASANATLFEVGSCAKALHALYDKEAHYRFIDPSEAYDPEGAITTVLKGIRPYGCLPAPGSSAYVRALKTIPGICVIPSPYINNCFHFFRKGEDNLCEASLKLEKIMQEKLENEGYDSIKSLNRILFSCRENGRLFYYHPDAIAAFEEKIKNMIKAELETRAANDPIPSSTSSSSSSTSSESSSSLSRD